MVQCGWPVGLDGIEVVFDDDNAIANAGIALISTLAQRLGVEQLADQCVELFRGQGIEVDRHGASGLCGLSSGLSGDYPGG